MNVLIPQDLWEKFNKADELGLARIMEKRRIRQKLWDLGFYSGVVSNEAGKYIEELREKKKALKRNLIMSELKVLSKEEVSEIFNEEDMKNIGDKIHDVKLILNGHSNKIVWTVLINCVQSFVLSGSKLKSKEIIETMAQQLIQMGETLPELYAERLSKETDKDGESFCEDCGFSHS